MPNKKQFIWTALACAFGVALVAVASPYLATVPGFNRVSGFYG